MAAYQKTETPNLILRTADGAMIPNTYGNADWEAYEEWVGKGNLPDPYVPPPVTPDAAFLDHMADGITLAWSDSSALDGTYAIDDTTQKNIMAEMISILANGVFGTGQVTRLWADITGQYHAMSIAEFRLFATAVQGYVNQLYAVRQELLMGQPASWPSNALNIEG